MTKKKTTPSSFKMISAIVGFVGLVSRLVVGSDHVASTFQRIQR